MWTIYSPYSPVKNSKMYCNSFIYKNRASIFYFSSNDNQLAKTMEHLGGGRGGHTG